GNGMGGEYLKMKHEIPAASNESFAQTTTAVNQEPVDAASLGLKRNKAGSVQLSPLKKKRLGSAVEDGARKKTRFVTDKGIKEAGRESLGVVGSAVQKPVGEEDDDLDIV
ncbi:MAG: hypothetical protein Q9225_004019, partial [Loekoesia sp. 1 TL-2023]